jgi:ABC-2 type transport system permease protein
MVLIWMIDFCIAALIGLSAFVVEDVSAFEWIYSKVMFIFGGLLLPLDFYPTWLQQLSRFLPFSYTVYGPARFFVDPSLSRLFPLVAGQVFWLVLLGGLVWLFYNRGVQRLVINGG